MSFVTQPLRLSDRDLAFVGRRDLLMGAFRNEWRSKSCGFFLKYGRHERLN